MGIEGLEALKPGTEPPKRPNGFLAAHTPQELLGMLAGAASVCWEKPERAGIFDSTRASALVDEALAQLHEIAPLHHTDETLIKVYQALRKANIDPDEAQGIISDMQNQGIYFREIKP